MFRKVTTVTSKAKNINAINKIPQINQMYENFKNPKTEIGFMAKRVVVSLGICSVAIVARLIGIF